jgi:hypothetical protein
MRFYGEKISKGKDTCKVQVIDMVDGTALTEHGNVMNIEGCK